ncbi:MAG: Dabb family protein [Pelagibaca sp.]
MILHCVFCAFRADTNTEMRHAILSDLERFSLALDGVLGFDHGPNGDFEGKSQQVTDGFVIRFRDRAALAVYADHPTHKSLGARLCDLCDGGAAGIMVVDLVLDRKPRDGRGMSDAS